MVTETLAALAQPWSGAPLWNLFPDSRLSGPDPDTHLSLDTSSNLKFQFLHLLHEDHGISL